MNSTLDALPEIACSKLRVGKQLAWALNVGNQNALFDSQCLKFALAPRRRPLCDALQREGTVKIRMTEAEHTLLKLRAQSAPVAAAKDPLEAVEIAAGTYADTAELKASLRAYHELQRRAAPTPGEQEAAQIALTSAFANLKLVQEAKIKATETELAQLGKSVTDQAMESISAKARESEYLMARREYELQCALLNEMQETCGRLKVELEMPLIFALRHENAYPSRKIARPQGELLLAIGASIALMLGLALAFILEYCSPD